MFAYRHIHIYETELLYFHDINLEFSPPQNKIHFVMKVANKNFEL